MADELDERLLHELAHLRVGRHQINGAVHRKHGAQLGHLRQLADHRLAPESGQPVVPDGGQQLLNVRMGHELDEKSKRKTSIS